jgi:hypothetical protein
LRILWFHVFAVIEWSALFSLIFAMFRFRLREYVSFIVIISFFISMFSYLLRDVLEIVSIAPLIQLVLLFFVFKFILRIPMVYAGIILSYGFITFGSLQTLLILAFEKLSLVEIDGSFLKNFNFLYVLQVVTSIINFCIVGFLIQFRIGFTFIPKHNFRGNLPFWILILFVLTVAGIYLINIEVIAYMQAMLIATTILSGVLLYFLLKREVEYK